MSAMESTLEYIRGRLKQEAARPASDRFRELVAAGIIDEEGRYTRNAEVTMQSDDKFKYPSDVSFVPTKDETIAYEKVHSYRRGWTDGASGRPEDQKFIAHPTRPDLTDEYRRGYHDGGDARVNALNKACRRLKYDAEKAVLR